MSRYVVQPNSTPWSYGNNQPKPPRGQGCKSGFFNMDMHGNPQSVYPVNGVPQAWKPLGTSGFQSRISTQIIVPNPFDDMGVRGSYLARKSGFNAAIPGQFGKQQPWQTGKVNTEIITPNRYDGFVPGRESKWGIGYGGDSWAETEMGFNGMSAFVSYTNGIEDECPEGTKRNLSGGCEVEQVSLEGFSVDPYGNILPGLSLDYRGKFEGFLSSSKPVYRADHYAVFAGDDEALADYESFDDCFDDGTRRMHLSSDSRGVERKSASDNYRKALFSAEKSLAGVGYMTRNTPQTGSDTNMARVQRPVDGAPQNRRWVFDPSTRRWHK